MEIIFDLNDLDSFRFLGQLKARLHRKDSECETDA